MVLSWRREDLGWMSGGHSLLWEWWGAETAAQGGCVCPVHPWSCSRPGWMGLWAAWAGIKCGRVIGPVCGGGRGRGVWSFMILEDPSNPGHSVILYISPDFCYLWFVVQKTQLLLLNMLMFSWCSSLQETSVRPVASNRDAAYAELVLDVSPKTQRVILKKKVPRRDWFSWDAIALWWSKIRSL